WLRSMPSRVPDATRRDHRQIKAAPRPMTRSMRQHSRLVGPSDASISRANRMEWPMPTDAAVSAPDQGSAVRAVLRAEGGVAFALALAAYHAIGYSWWLFAATLLLPDLAMLGYLRGPRIGATTYNLAHTYLAPFLLAIVGYLAGVPLLLALAAVWA